MPGFSGVGRVTTYTRTVNGLPGIGTFWGNCPKLAINHTPNVVERNESMTTARGPLRRMTQTTSATMEIVCDEFNKANFARSTLGRIEEVDADPTVTYTFPVTGVKAGDVLKLPDRNVSDVVIKDSTGTPKVVPADNYEVDEFDGSITFHDVTTGGAYVQPFKAEYARGTVTVISGLSVPDPELWVGMSGTNVDTGEPGVLDVYRVRFAIADVIEFINNDYQDYTMKGTVLSDLTKQSSDLGGKYYRFTLPTLVA